MFTTTHRPWCSDHRLEEDREGSAADVCKHSVTRGRFTVDVEDCPSWTERERDQIVVPEIPYDVSCTASDARDLAAALLETARLVEGGQR